MKIKLDLFAVKVISLLFVYYILLILFALVNIVPKQSEVLNTRIGTILFHSSLSEQNNTLVGHIYCYYPKSNVLEAKQGEFLIKRVFNLDDCKDWFGIVIRYEYSWMSEQQMLKKNI